MKPYYESRGQTIYQGDCREVLPTLKPVEAAIMDPPYGLSFMGKGWDRGVPGVEFWQAISSAMKPGAHLLAFGGTRTFHRLTCAIEDAGFEIRDCLMYLYGTGFPKSLNVGKQMDKMAGAERKVMGPGRWNHVKGSNAKQKDCLIRPGGKHDETAPTTNAAKQWEGWGTALKPAWEPIILARKPLEGTVAANVLKHGTAALNIDACRRESTDEQLAEKYASVKNAPPRENAVYGKDDRPRSDGRIEPHANGRWPANVIHDGSEEVVEMFPSADGGEKREASTPTAHDGPAKFGYSPERHQFSVGDSGSAARFFYCAKASKKDRGYGNNHPTVKPIALMRYLCRLVTPPGGVVCDPFMGSGSTLVAAQADYFCAIGIELESKYVEIAVDRLAQQVFDFGGGGE